MRASLRGSKERSAGAARVGGDKIFLRLLDENVPFFSLKLRYEGETLAEAKLNGKALEVQHG